MCCVLMKPTTTSPWKLLLLLFLLSQKPKTNFPHLLTSAILSSASWFHHLAFMLTSGIHTALQLVSNEHASFCNLSKMLFTWYATLKIALHMEIIQVNLCHPWTKWANYNLWGKTTRIEFKHDFNICTQWYETSKEKFYATKNKSKFIILFSSNSNTPSWEQNIWISSISEEWLTIFIFVLDHMHKMRIVHIYFWHCKYICMILKL
jgi:hypothetical protein